MKQETINIITSKIKQQAIILFKEVYGRGPEKVVIDFEENMMVFSIKHSVGTSIFLNFINEIPDIKGELDNIKLKILENQEEEIYKFLENTCGVKPVDLIMKMNYEMNSLFGLVLFKEKIIN
jgi:uncharacterized protein YbcI